MLKLKIKLKICKEIKENIKKKYANFKGKKT